MGALPRGRWGGRWTAVNSLWTYIHRVLHLLGIAAVDKEEVALLSAPLVRIRATRPRHRPLVLAHHADPLHPDEPLGWADPTTIPLPPTLFFLHYDTTDEARPDRARLATAAPSQTSPRAWLTVDHKSGALRLVASEHHAALFHLRSAASSGRPAHVTLACTCAAGTYLSVHPTTLRARVCAAAITHAETFLVNHVPLPPTLAPLPDTPPLDCTMAVACAATRQSPVRIQSRSLSVFLASKPGAPLAAASGKDTGWDGFTLEYDSTTRSARLRDSRGLYLAFGPELDDLVAAAGHCADGAWVDAEARDGVATSPERFFVETVGDDDRVVLRSRKGYVSARRGGRIVLSQNTLPRRQEQFYLRLALPSMMDQSTPRLTLRVRAGGARQVDATILVPAPARIAYEVLRDYDGFSGFISDASESRILERKSATELSVLMVQCHSFLMLTIPMTMVLNVVEDLEEKVVTMDLERGLGVKQYKGVWQAIERNDGRCLIRCSLLAATSVPAPGFLIDGLMSHATHSTMEQLRVECIHRSTMEQPKPPRRRSRSLAVEPPTLEAPKLIEAPAEGLTV